MAKPDLLLHIGQFKTGTSSIQRILGARRAALAKLGVHYPTSPGWTNHGLLAAALVPLSKLGDYNPANWEGMGPEQRLARFRREFAEEMASLPATTRLVVISAEQLSGLLVRRELIAALKELVSPFVGRIRVLVYLRRQDSHYASVYSQAVRLANIGPAALPEGGPKALRRYDYSLMLDHWAAVFGEAAVEPRIFEPESLVNGDVVDDFLTAAGIPLEVPKDEPDRRSNRSLSAGGLDLLRAVGARMRQEPTGLASGDPVWRRVVQAADDALPGRGWRPAPAEAAAFLARFAEANEAVRKRWFPDRATLFTGEGRPVPPEAAAPAAPAAPDDLRLDRDAALAAACDLILAETRGAMAREAALHVTIGRLQEKLGQAAAAQNAWRQAIRAEPDNAVAQQRLAELALASGDLAGAEARLVRLRAAHPDNPLTERLARQLAKAQKDFAEKAGNGEPAKDRPAAAGGG